MVTALTPLTELDDKHLVRLSLEKAPGAYNTLIKRYIKYVYNFIYRYVRSVELAEDLTQETFVRVYRNLKNFDPERPFKPWVLTIATNVSKTSLIRIQKEPVQPESETNPLDNLADTLVLEESISDVGVMTAVERALDQLPSPIRHAMILRHIYDLPCEEIATILDANPNTVKTWLRRGRETLKTFLERHGGFD